MLFLLSGYFGKVYKGFGLRDFIDLFKVASFQAKALYIRFVPLK